MKESTILNPRRKRATNIVFTMVVIGVSFLVINTPLTPIEEAVAIGPLAILVVAGLAFAAGALWQWSEGQDTTNTQTSPNEGAGFDPEGHYNTWDTYFTRWNNQYITVNANHKNLQNNYLNSHYAVGRRCSNEVVNFVDKDYWHEVMDEMECFERVNNTILGTVLGFMNEYGVVDRDILSETRILNGFSYVDIYQPYYVGASVGGGTHEPLFGLDWAGNYEIDGDIKLGEYYVSFVYVPTGKTATIDGTSYIGGTSGRTIVFYETYEEVGFPVLQTHNISYVSDNTIYIAGIHKDSFGYPSYDAEYYREAPGLNPIYTKEICAHAPAGGCPASDSDIVLKYINDNITKVYLRYKWNYDGTDLTKIDLNVNIQVNESAYLRQYNVDIDGTETAQDYWYIKEIDVTDASVINEIKIVAGAQETGTNTVKLWAEAWTDADIGSGKLFFRREYGKPLTSWFNTIGEFHVYEDKLPAKNTNIHNNWLPIFNRFYTNAVNQAFATWVNLRNQGFNNPETIPSDLVPIYPDILIGNLESFAGINETEYYFMYNAILQQLFGNLEDYYRLYNFSVIGPDDIKISDFSQYLAYANFSYTNTWYDYENQTWNASIEEHDPAYVWISPLEEDLTLNASETTFLTQRVMVLDIDNRTFYYLNEFHSITPIIIYEDGEEVDNATWTILDMESYTQAKYNLTYNATSEFLVEFTTMDITYLTYAGLVAIAGIVIMSVSERLRPIGTLLLIGGLLFGGYIIATVYIWPWIQGAWANFLGWLLF